MPAAIRSQPTPQAAARVAALHAVHLPFVVFPKAVGSGVANTVKSRWRWLRVLDLYEAADKNSKLDDRWKELRYDRHKRDIITIAWSVALFVVLLVLWIVATTVTWLIVGGAVAVFFAWKGRHDENAGGRKAPLGPRSVSWTLDPTMLDDRFAEAGVIKRTATVQERLHVVTRPYRDADGWAVVVDLPGTAKADDAIRKHNDLASSFAVDEVQLVLERVRGRDGHAGRLSLWLGDQDPYTRERPQFPLLGVDQWDAWNPAPFGEDPRNKPIKVGLMWSNMLIASQPGRGKTFAGRVVAMPFVLDPHVRVYCWNGKGSRDWRHINKIAYKYGEGATDDECVRLRDTLAELKDEAMQRFGRMSDLPDEVCPENKITPELSRDPSMGLGLIFFVIDELQNYTECGVDGWRMNGKKATVGQNISQLLVWHAKNDRALGASFLFMTQRPDSSVLPTALRSQIGWRFALPVDDWRESNMILGDQMNTRGYNAAMFEENHDGVGILKADREVAKGQAPIGTVRVCGMDGLQWRERCEQGRRIREQYDLLEGEAAGKFVGVDHRRVERAASSNTNFDGSSDDVIDGEVEAVTNELPDLLAAIRDYIDDEDRDHIASAELMEEVVEGVLGLHMTPHALGRQLSRWGAPPVQAERGGPRGPMVAALRATIARIEVHGVMETADVDFDIATDEVK